jgi:hypothetical protein
VIETSLRGLFRGKYSIVAVCLDGVAQTQDSNVGLPMHICQKGVTVNAVILSGYDGRIVALKDDPLIRFEASAKPECFKLFLVSRFVKGFENCVG